MAEQQMQPAFPSLPDIQGKIVEGFEFEQLDTKQEFVLELVDWEFKKNTTSTYLDNSRIVDRFKTVWQVEGHSTKVWKNFNITPPIDTLPPGKAPDYSDKLAVVIFAKRIGRMSNDQFNLKETFAPHMRIRCRLKPPKAGEGEGQFYKIDMDTVMPYHVGASTPNPTPGGTPEQQAEIERICSFLHEGRFAKREEAENIGKKFMNMTDGTLFAVAWAKYAKSDAARASPVIVGS